VVVVCVVVVVVFEHMSHRAGHVIHMTFCSQRTAATVEPMENTTAQSEGSGRP
jgi:hypothetical protein